MPARPVDTAIKVKVGPCIDDTDFKSTEVVTWNQAGLSITAQMEKADGTITTTAITSTNPDPGGLHDLSDLGDGYFSLELPASTGDYNNDEEGILTIVGVATGILPFSSVAYDIIPVLVHNALNAGSIILQTNPTQLGADGAKTQNMVDLVEIAQKLFAAAATLTSVLHDDSVFGKLLAKSAVTNFDRTTDSQEGIRDTAPGTNNAALAATALSDANWTNTRAGYLDELKAANIPADVDTLLSRISGNIASIVDAIWDELLSGHTDVGSAGKQLSDANPETPVNLQIGGETIVMEDE